MDFDTSQWTTAIAQNLIAAIVIYGMSKLYSLAKPSIVKVSSVAIPVTKKMWPAIGWIAADILVIWFLVSQLRGAISVPPPLTGGNVALISFWMWWCMLYFVKICQFDFIKRKN